jgi:DNA helicase HerA-like ATPase
MTTPLESVPRTSFRLPFGIGFGEPLKADTYDSENIVIGRTAPDAAPAALYLGKLAEFEQMRRNVWLDCHGAHAVYVVGKRRSGKSYTLGALCEGLVANSWLRMGVADQAVLLIDTLNIYGTLHVAADMTGRDTGLWQLPSHVANVRYVAPEVTRSTIASESTRLTIDPAWLTLEDWCGFFDIDPFADPLGHLLGVVLNGARERWQQPAGAIEVAGIARTGIEDCIYALDGDPEALRFGESTREALRRRLLALERLGFLARPSPRVEDLLASGVITVCQLRDLDDRIRSLIVAVLIREVMRARARADASSRLQSARQRLGGQRSEQEMPRGADGAPPVMPRCWIAIDEAHNYLPSGGSLPSRPVLRRLITEGRNIGLSVVVATQQPSGLDSSIQRNADALLVHSMSMRDDIVAAEGMINTQIPDSATWGTAERVSGKVFEKVVRALPQGYCLVSTDTANRIFGLRVRPRLTMHGGETY